MPFDNAPAEVSNPQWVYTEKRLGQEPVPLLRGRHAACVPFSENTVAVPRYDTVKIILHRTGNVYEERGKLPDPPEPAKNQKNGVGAFVNPVFVKIGDFPLARRFVLIKGKLSGRLPLDRGKEYFLPAVFTNDEIDEPVAEPANAVKENHRFF